MPKASASQALDYLKRIVDKWDARPVDSDALGTARENTPVFLAQLGALIEDARNDLGLPQKQVASDLPPAPPPETVEALRAQIGPHPKLYKDVSYEVTLPDFDCGQWTHKLEVGANLDFSRLPARN